MGAWIETLMFPQVSQKARVAPRVGAWIETCYKSGFSRRRKSRAPRGRVD
uniref:Uncharacterized protein n=1 Tax=uncultured bacterium contig00101 TaxID=1181568 RepID=A0A806KHJ6_9BACT|nr:hypothetical protein [uncultured bacterium contig00101]